MKDYSDYTKEELEDLLDDAIGEVEYLEESLEELEEELKFVLDEKEALQLAIQKISG